MTEQEQTQQSSHSSPDLDGRYTGLALISERQMSCAFSAEDARTGQRVFIKMLRESKVGDATAERLFANEAALLQLIGRQSPSVPIVPVIDTGIAGDRPYFVQPLLDGFTLRAALRRHPHLAGHSATRLLEGCLEFLVSLHASGIAHGDLSPDNIFIETVETLAGNGRLPDQFEIRLLDYNSARRIEGPENQAQRIVFLKLPYAAPELAKGHPLSPQSDLYSLAVVLYEAISGERPYDVKTIAEVAALRENSFPPIPLAFDVPRPIEKFIRTLGSADPSARPHSAADALRELRDFKDVHKWLSQIEAPPLPALYRRAEDRRSDGPSAPYEALLSPEPGDQPITVPREIDSAPKPFASYEPDSSEDGRNYSSIMSRKLGESLLKDHLITPQQLEEALDYQRINGGRLASTLVRLFMVSDEEINAALGRLYGVSSVNLDTFEVDREAIALVPQETCERYSVLPLSRVGTRLTLAMVDPTDVFAIDDIRFRTGFFVDPVVVSERKLNAAVQKYYGISRTMELALAIDDMPAESACAPDYADVPTAPEAVEPVGSFDSSQERAESSMAYSVPVPSREQEVNKVDFSVFAPASISPGTSFILEVWAYLREQRDQLLELAGRHGRLIERGSRGPVLAESGTELTLVLRLDGFDVADPHESFFWLGEISNVPFIVKAPPDLRAGVYPGQISITHAGMLLTRLIFDVEVGESVGETSRLGVRSEKIKSAFASYASSDREEVLRRVQGIMAAGVDVFLDVLSLRAGDTWEEQLIKNIRERDIFYLFWSVAASKSKWVDREWRYALNEKGIEYIQPIPLTDPREAPPPDELAGRHFNDLILAYLKSSSTSAN